MLFSQSNLSSSISSLMTSLGAPNVNLAERLWNQLVADFQRSGIDTQRSLPVHIFLHRLQASNAGYDVGVLKNLYSNAERYTGLQYAKLYIEKEQVLRQRIKELEEELSKTTALVEDTKTSLRRHEAGDRMQNCADHNVEDSILTVHLGTLQLLHMPANNRDSPDVQFSIRLDCQAQDIETPPVAPKEDKSVIWDTLVSFAIHEAVGYLTLTLQRDGVAEALTAVDLAALADQRKHEVSKPVQGEHVSGTVSITCQWIHSRKLLYQGLLEELAEQQKQCQESLDTARWEWNALSRPFGVNRPSTGEMLADFAQATPQVLSASIEGALRHMQLNSFQKALHYAMIVSLMLSCASCYARSMFLDISVALFGLWCSFDGACRWTCEVYTFMLIIIGISFMVDLSWMLFYFADDEDNNALAAITLGLRGVTRFFSLVNFLWKTLLFLLFWKCRYDVL